MNLNVITEEDAVEAVEAVKKDPSPPPEIADPEKDTPAGKAPQTTKDDLYSRVLKFIPAPLLGIYLMVTNLILNGNNPSETLLWAVFVFTAILVGLYLYFRDIRRWIQVALSVLAFAAFAAASPGPFQTIDGWQELWGTLALAGAGALLITIPIQPLKQD